MSRATAIVAISPRQIGKPNLFWLVCYLTVRSSFVQL